MTISSFGKVILFGEHAVVYGEPALAAALEVGARVSRVARPPSASPLTVFVSPWNTKTTLGETSRMGDALQRIHDTVQEGQKTLSGVEIHMEIDLPVGAGLGSSAAWAVCLAKQIYALSNPGQMAPDALIAKAALEGEKVFHGNPSGIDHTTSALGGIVSFQRGQKPAMTRLNLPGLPLIIAQMEPGADTGKMVASVRSLVETEPSHAHALIRLLGEISLSAQSALEDKNLSRIGTLMNMAHGALSGLGVSTHMLDAGCHAARQAGAWGAKLTGSGGGGCMIAVAPEDKTDAVLQALLDLGAVRAFSCTAGATQ